MTARFLAAIFLAAPLALYGTAWADSCPYCGQSYGEAAPGDESRVYGLRSEHEASCSYRTSGTSGETSSGGARWTRQDQIAYEQELLAQQEIQRQIAEQKRKDKIKQEAAERAEHEVRRLQWEEKKRGLASMLKGASPAIADTGLKSSGGDDVFLTPRGVKYSPDKLVGDEKAEAVRTRIVEPGEVTVASDSSAENIRRSLWLYQKAAQAPTAQEAAFLVQQADEAAQGHALRVEVPPAARIPQITPEKIARYKEIKTGIETQRIQAEMLQGKKRTLEDRRNLDKRRTDDLEVRLQEVRAQKEVERVEAAKKAAAPPASAEPPQETPSAETEPESEKAVEKAKDTEEDLLGQLLEAQKRMEEADQALGELSSEEAGIQKNISDQEKSLGAVLDT